MMTRYTFKDVSFQPPADWQERSMIAFAAGGAAGKHAPNVVLTQEPLREGEKLRSYVDRLLMQLAKDLAHFEILESSEVTVGDLPGITMRFLWTSFFGTVEQTMTLIDTGGVVTNFTATASVEQAAEARAEMAKMLRTVQFARPRAETRPALQSYVDELAPVVPPMPGTAVARRR